MDPYTEFAIAKKDERIDNLEARLKDAEGILEKYADRHNWAWPKEHDWLPSPNGFDLAQEYFEKWGK